MISVSLFLFISCNKKSEGEEEALSRATEKESENKADPETFKKLRRIAFTTTPEQLRLSLPKDKTVVYGVIMDMEMGSAVATLTTFQTGDASLYLSNGGGIIGGFQHQNVNIAAKQFVTVAQAYLDKATKTETTALPAADEVIFYLLTNDGIYSCHETFKDFEDNTSEFTKLFEEGNKVLTELRLVSDKN